MIIGKCTICNKEGYVVAHHVCYFPEMIQQVCYSCHRLIHKNGKTSLGGQYKEVKNVTKTLTVSQEMYEVICQLALKEGLPKGRVLEDILKESLARK